MMPVPTHLKSIVIPREKSVDEEPFVGDLLCRCGSKSFRMNYPGKTQEFKGKVHPCTIEIDGNFFFLIKAICTKCDMEYLLFDKHFHGWDGFLCHDKKEASLPRPVLVPWECLSCGNMGHKVTIEVSSLGKDDFMDATKGKFGEDKWQDAFEWIWISIECTKCGLKTENWVDYETM